MKTAEEILSSLISKKNLSILQWDLILKAMEEYAQQIKLPSDEEIEKQADLKFDNWSNKAFWSGGAKWAVDWIKDKMK